MKKKKRKNPKYEIYKIKYLKKDRQALLSFVKEFKEGNISLKKQMLKRNHLKSFIGKCNKQADELLLKAEEPVTLGFSIIINQLYYSYYNAKKRFSDSDVFNEELEKKLDRLAELAVIIECGKIYKMRQSLSNPECINISSLLKKKNAFQVYFNSGVKALIDIEHYAYALDLMEKQFKMRFSSNRIKKGTKRAFYIHVGKTNSGKTYNSIQLLKKAEKGAYLSPLRLLALEVSDSLNSEGIACDLITGEEERLVENATHVASTVELANFRTDYDVVVIDECQMIADPSRGHSWTKAIMNIRAREICLCTAPEALDVLISLIDNCGDFYTIVNHRRKTPLVVEDTAFTIDDAKKGDALVAFSKQKVNAIGAQLINKGISVSVLYGALPYKARKQQFESFIEGKSEVLVTTDAIGMGVNLPVRRIVFMETYKYDGKANRLLSPGEIKQIAGRAGRRGKFDTGYVTARGERELEFIKKGLKIKTSGVEGICVNFPVKILDNEYIDLKNALEAWRLYKVPAPYIKESLAEAEEAMVSIIKLYKRLDMPMNKREIFETAIMPVDSRSPGIMRLWLEYIEMKLKGARYLRKPYIRKKTVDEYLNYSKMLDTYYLCSRSWKMSIDTRWLEEQRQRCNEALIDGLIDNVERHTRYCEVCGNVLDWDNRGSCCPLCDEAVITENSSL